MSIIGVVCCWTLAGVFAVAAVTKARTRAARTAFRAAIAQLARVPDRLTGILAAAVILAEAATAGLLAVPATNRPGLIAAGVLLAAFTAVLVLAERTRTRASCNCFGAAGVPAGRHGVIRNLALLAVVVAGWWPAGTRPPALAATEFLLAAVAAAGGVVAVVAWDLVGGLTVHDRPAVQ